MKKSVSVNQFVKPAVAEKIAFLSAGDCLEMRAKQGSRETLLRILEKAPDAEPEAYDRL